MGSTTHPVTVGIALCKTRRQTPQRTLDDEEQQQRGQRQRRQQHHVGQGEPTLSDGRADERRGRRYRHHPRGCQPQRYSRPTHRSQLQRAVGFHDQPAGTQQHVRAQQAHGDQRREEHSPSAVAKAGHPPTEHVALRQAGQHRPRVEGPVPQCLAVDTRLGAEVEGHAAQRQTHQHQRHRQVERAQDQPVSWREGHQQDAHAEHQPRFVCIPERTYRRDHRVFVAIACGAQQRAHAQVVAVEDDVGQHRQTHDGK